MMIPNGLTRAGLSSMPQSLPLDSKPISNHHKMDIVWISVSQECGNTMPNLSDLVPFHSGQVEIFNLLVLGQVQNLL